MGAQTMILSTVFCLVASSLQFLLLSGSLNSNWRAHAFSTAPFTFQKAHLNVIKATGKQRKFFRYEYSSPGFFLQAASEERDDAPLTDDDLLETVPESQFQELCRQLNLSTKGTKEELLARLRKHANDQAEKEEKRRLDLKARVEEGVNFDERERHEILGSENNFQFEDDGEEEEEEEVGVFYFGLPTDPNEEKKKKAEEQKLKAKEQSVTTQKKRPFVTQNDVLAPPPPPPSDATVDEDGNRVVTVYSTTDQNDLTGVAAAQPGQAALSGTDPMAAGSNSGQPQPWDMDHEQTNKAATSSELEASKEKVTELVQTLLAMSGAPAFRHFDMPEELEDLEGDDEENEVDSYTASAMATDYSATINGKTGQNVGFDPSEVPAHLLTEASQAIRANRGQVLQEVLRKFEIHAVGQDGMSGDNLEDGGGHYKEVSKVRAFLEGYRRAEVRKAARVTVTFLLDKLVSEGVEGLDLSLASMSRSNDDSASETDAFELNDSLINYLNDIIREQEKKVDQLGSSSTARRGDRALVERAFEAVSDDTIDGLWNQTTGDDGETIESIDPNDPMVNRILKQALEKEDHAAANAMSMGLKEAIPEEAPEKLLLLLMLLRERIKTEAAFAGDERSRSLRLLAYCLQCTSEADREELIMKELGNSIDRLDAFLELVSSSIEYAESTTHKLQPAKHMPLNVPLLKSILKLSESIREKQAWKASGVRP